MPDRTARHAESTRCTALDRRGRFCDEDSLPEAPFPICLRHASAVLRYLNSVAPDELDDRIIVAARAFEQANTLQDRIEKRKQTAEDSRGVVYYVRVGSLVKIGYTYNLRARMAQYPPNSELLAVEPGQPALESRRHVQFADSLSARKEWFDPTPDLLAHIDGLRVAA